LAGFVLADAAEHLVVSSKDGVHELTRGRGDAPAPVRIAESAESDRRAAPIAIGRVNGRRIVVLALEGEEANAVRIVEDGKEPRDVALPAGRAEVRALAVDRDGRILAVRETVIDTLEHDASAFVRAPLVGRGHAWAAAPSADGRELFVVGDEGERGVVIKVTREGQQTFASTDTRIWRAWASSKALWGIDTKENLYRIDLATRAVTVEHPNVGELRAIAGVETTRGDVVVVSGDVAAVYDGKTFRYPSGKTSAMSSIAIDPASENIYLTGDAPLARIGLSHPWINGREAPFPAPFVEGAEHGPLGPVEPPRPKAATLPSIRLGYGYGWNGEHDSVEFDALVGLRFGVELGDRPHFYLWPEAGYSASAGGRFATLGAGVQYGNYLVSTGPSVRGLLGAEDGGSEAAAVRSSWHVVFVSGLLNLELGHQLSFVPGGPRHDGRALASIDLFAGGGLLIYLGIPLALVTGVLVTELVN